MNDKSVYMSPDPELRHFGRELKVNLFGGSEICVGIKLQVETMLDPMLEDFADRCLAPPDKGPIKKFEVTIKEIL